jgi:LPXTG-site transpeptidase (sortase) family protein
MSVTVPRNSAPEESPRRARAAIGLDAWILCAEFVERLLTEARQAAGQNGTHGSRTEIDLERIWRAGGGAPNDEVAIGKIVRAASEAARQIAGGSDHAAGSVVEPGAVGAPVVEATPPTPTPTPTPTPPPPPTQPPPATALVDPVVAPEPPAATPPTAPQPPPLAAPLAVPLVAPEPPADPATVVMPRVAAPVVVPGSPVDSPTSVVEPIAPAEEPATRVEPVVVEPVVVESVAQDAPSTVAVEPEVAHAESQAERKRAGWLTAFTWTRNIGAVILLFVLWQLWGTAISQHQAQDQLRSAFEAGLKAHHAPPVATKGGLIPASARFGNPADGTQVAELQIPAIGLDQIVVSGTNASDLAKGPGHYVGTALPGQAGNVAIAGHRTTNGAPFNRLGELKTGDRILLTTTWGEHLTYVVSGTPQAVSPSDVSVLNYFGDNRITLTTCTPEYSSTQRLVVVGKLEGHGGTTTPPAKQISYHVADTGTASWDWSLLPLVGIEACLLVLLGLSYRRFDGWFGRRSKWVILIPVWAAGLYLLFGTLTAFLPATV